MKEDVDDWCRNRKEKINITNKCNLQFTQELYKEEDRKYWIKIATSFICTYLSTKSWKAYKLMVYGVSPSGISAAISCIRIY